MRAKPVWTAVAAVGVLSVCAAVMADTGQICREDAMVVFDASGSMTLADADGRVRIEVARESLASVLPEITEQRRTGLVVYGPGGSCHVDVKLRPALGTAAAISGIVAETDASGATPLGRAVETAVGILGGGDKPGLVVLVTDGEDNCGTDPCDLGKRLSQQAPRTIVHVIGFMMGHKDAVHASCLADETNGLYVPARTFEELRAALQAALGCPRFSLSPRWPWVTSRA